MSSRALSCFPPFTMPDTVLNPKRVLTQNQKHNKVLTQNLNTTIKTKSNKHQAPPHVPCTNSSRGGDLSLSQPPAIQSDPRLLSHTTLLTTNRLNRRPLSNPTTHLPRPLHISLIPINPMPPLLCTNRPNRLNRRRLPSTPPQIQSGVAGEEWTGA